MNRIHNRKSKSRVFALSALAAAVSLGSHAVSAGDDLQDDAREAKQETKEAYREAKAETKAGWSEFKADAGEVRRDMTDASRNAWLHGKLETTLLLNRHLNNFTIDSRVENGTAFLDGTVESDIDKELAGQVAMSIEGIERVENNLSVDAEYDGDDVAAVDRSFSQRIDDATTTAMVKSKLLANEHTHGLSINVDTANDVVTLRGSVKSSEEKTLAEAVASNTEDVKSVVNNLQVVRDKS